MRSQLNALEELLRNGVIGQAQYNEMRLNVLDRFVRMGGVATSAAQPSASTVLEQHAASSVDQANERQEAQRESPREAPAGNVTTPQTVAKKKRGRPPKAQKATPKKRKSQNEDEDGDMAREDGGGDPDDDGDPEDDGEGSSAKKSKLSIERRALHAIPQWGLGGNDFGDTFDSFMARRRRPWHLRDDVGQTRGPFGLDHVREWMADDSKQLEFAQCFAVDVSDEAHARRIRKDNPAEVVNYTSKFLFTSMMMNPATGMEISRSKLICSAVLAQHCMDRTKDVFLDDGPCGGFVGLADCCFWRMEKSGDLNSFDADLLRLANMLAEGTRTGISSYLCFILNTLSQTRLCDFEFQAIVVFHKIDDLFVCYFNGLNNLYDHARVIFIQHVVDIVGT